MPIQVEKLRDNLFTARKSISCIYSNSSIECLSVYRKDIQLTIMNYFRLFHCTHFIKTI